jgi:hypothetical protein
VNAAPENFIEGVTETKKTQISRFFSKLLEIFAPHPKKTFATVSATNRHGVRLARQMKKPPEGGFSIQTR